MLSKNLSAKGTLRPHFSIEKHETNADHGQDKITKTFFVAFKRYTIKNNKA